MLHIEGIAQDGSQVGILKRIASVFRDTSTEKVLEYLHGMGIEAELVGKPRRIKVTGQNFDEMRVSVGGGQYSGARYRIQYVVRGTVMGPDKSLKAKSKGVKERRFWGKVLDVKWAGKEVAQLLNRDADLTRKLIEEGQTSIEIKVDPKRQSVEIISPSFPTLFHALPSRASFDAYNNIAKHVRNTVGR